MKQQQWKVGAKIINPEVRETVVYSFPFLCTGLGDQVVVQCVVNFMSILVRMIRIQIGVVQEYSKLKLRTL